MHVSDLSRRTFLIFSAASTSLAWLEIRDTAPAQTAPAARTAVPAERPHRTLLGVL